MPGLQVFRAWKGTRAEMRSLRNPKFLLKAEDKCCAERARASKRGKFLVMGERPAQPGAELKPTFIVPWSKSKVRIAQENLICFLARPSWNIDCTTSKFHTLRNYLVLRLCSTAAS